MDETVEAHFPTVLPDEVRNPDLPSSQRPRRKHRRLWQAEILGPVLVVVGLWMLMSIGTTVYLRWLESQYDRVFSENLYSIQLATRVESTVWNTIAGWTDPTLDPDSLAVRQTASAQELLELLEQMPLSAQTPDAQNAQGQLQTAVTEICKALDTEVNISRTTRERSSEALQRLWKQATLVAVHASAVREINELLIASARERLAGTQSIVMVTRMSMLLLGPLIGLYLGWRVARRVQSSVSEIAVTLSDSGTFGESQEMTVSITQDSSFEDVRRQAGRVVERLRNVGQELQSARREVIQSERLAAVGELAAGVAHELRNPLTSVKLLLQHAARNPNTIRIGESQLQLILQEVGRMESTIQGLLDFSRTPTLHRVRHDLRETLHRSLNLVDGRIRQAKIELVTAVSPDPLWVNADAEQLNQVFVNLLLNAIESMDGGGRIRVTVRRGAEASAEVIVSDTGGGVPAEVMGRMFEPFATTKERGTGLGLAISHRIITEHKGTIHVDNHPQRGATFTVRLPLNVPQTAAGV